MSKKVKKAQPEDPPAALPPGAVAPPLAAALPVEPGAPATTRAASERTKATTKKVTTKAMPKPVATTSVITQSNSKKPKAATSVTKTTSAAEVKDRPVPAKEAAKPAMAAVVKSQNGKSAEIDKDVENSMNNSQAAPVLTTTADRGMIQPPTFQHHTTSKGKDKDDDQDLAVAVLVTEPEEKVAAASIYEGEETVPFFKRSVFWILIVALVVIAAVVISLAVTLSKDDDSPVPEPPVEPPTMAPTTQEEFLNRLYLQDLVGPDLIALSPEAFESAVRWINADELRFTNLVFELNVNDGTRVDDLLPEPVLNIQRFLLAWLYFHSTKNGQDPWLSCNPANTTLGEDETCRYLQSAAIEDPLDNSQVELCFSEISSKRWLSATPECEWPGVECDSNGSNTVIWLLNLRAHGMKGEFPQFLELMPALEILEMTYGSMSGTIPDLSNFVLGELVLIGNTFQSPIHDSLFEQPLIGLNLGYNQFNAPIPENITKLNPTIEFLYLMNGGFGGPLPEDLSDASGLQVFQAYGNNFGTSLPASWGSMTNLVELVLDNAGLTGTIPQEWSSLANMEYFAVSSNALEGPLPDMSTWSFLFDIYVGFNALNGTFPEEFL